jgi:hypothetical protein
MDKTYLKVIFEKGMYKNGGSIAVTIPKELLDYLDIEYDNEGNPLTKLKLIGDLNKNGMPYIGIWNPEQQEKIREAQNEKNSQ